MAQADTPSLHTQGDDSRHLKRSFIIVLSFTAALWLLKIFESILGMHLVRFGIYPGQLHGLGGILWSPLIHGSFKHLFANTLPLLVLGTALIYGYPKSAKIVIPVVYLGTGLAVWMFGREAYHVGISGLNFGFLLFVFVAGALRWDKRAITLSMIVFFLYGGMIWGVFPYKPDISFESHFSGALIGAVLAVLLRNHDPLPPQKRYSWEEESDADAASDVESRDRWNQGS